jgi:hypothetical protein
VEIEAAEVASEEEIEEVVSEVASEEATEVDSEEVIEAAEAALEEVTEVALEVEELEVKASNPMVVEDQVSEQEPEPLLNLIKDSRESIF